MPQGKNIHHKPKSSKKLSIQLNQTEKAPKISIRYVKKDQRKRHKSPLQSFVVRQNGSEDHFHENEVSSPPKQQLCPYQTKSDVKSAQKKLMRQQLRSQELKQQITALDRSLKDKLQKFKGSQFQLLNVLGNIETYEKASQALNQETLMMQEKELDIQNQIRRKEKEILDMKQNYFQVSRDLEQQLQRKKEKKQQEINFNKQQRQNQHREIKQKPMKDQRDYDHSHQNKGVKQEPQTTYFTPYNYYMGKDVQLPRASVNVDRQEKNIPQQTESFQVSTLQSNMDQDLKREFLSRIQQEYQEAKLDQNEYSLDNESYTLNERRSKSGKVLQVVDNSHDSELVQNDQYHQSMKTESTKTESSSRETSLSKTKNTQNETSETSISKIIAQLPLIEPTSIESTKYAKVTPTIIIQETENTEEEKNQTEIEPTQEKQITEDNLTKSKQKLKLRKKEKASEKNQERDTSSYASISEFLLKSVIDISDINHLMENYSLESSSQKE